MSLVANRKHNKRIVRQLTICGALMLVGYIGLFCIMQSPALWYDLRPDPVRSLFPDLFRPINQLFPDEWVNLTHSDPSSLVIIPLYLAVVALITAPLIYLLRKLPRRGTLTQSLKRPLLLRIFGFTIAAMLVLLFVRGLLSSDIYNYAWYSRIWVDHGASPYTHAPAQFPPDPEGSIYWIGWPNEPAVYGPAWLMVSSAFYKVGEAINGTFSAKLLSLRLLADIAHLFNAFLVWSIAGLLLARRKAPPRQKHYSRMRPRPLTRSPRSNIYHHSTHRHAAALKAGQPTGKRLGIQFAALLFYIWNPLLLVEFGASGHNDALMLTFVLLAVWLHLKGLWPVAAASLGVAALVKLPALVFIPGYLWLLLWTGARSGRTSPRKLALPQGIWRATRGLAAILATWVILYIPFWEGPRTLLALVSGPANRLYLHTLQADIVTNAPAHLTTFLHTVTGTTQSQELIASFLDSYVRILFLVITALVALFVTWRARTTRRMLIAWGWVALAAIVSQGWFWPWYVSWVIAPAAIAPSRRLRATILTFSVSSLLLYLEEQILGSQFAFFHDWSGILVIAPPLAYAVTSLLLERRQKRRASTSSVATPGRVRPGAPIKAN